MDELESKLSDLLENNQFASAYKICKSVVIGKKNFSNYKALPLIVKTLLINSKYDELFEFIYSLDLNKRLPSEIQKSIAATLIILGRAITTNVWKREDAGDFRTIISDAVFMINGEMPIFEHALEILNSHRDKTLAKDVVKEFKQSFSSEKHNEMYSKFAF